MSSISVRISVTVQPTNGDAEIFLLEETATAPDLKDCIAERLGISVSKQILTHGRKIVKDNTIALKEFFGTEAYELRLFEFAGVEFEQNFEVDASSQAELEQHYPHIEAQDKDVITVASGVLIKAGQGKGDIIYTPVHEGVDLTRIVYKISITCGEDRYNCGLGCLVCPADCEDLTRSGSSTRFCFHPGMGGGQFRVEGAPEYMGNRDIGFTPPLWEASVGGTEFLIELNKSGDHNVTLTHPTDGTNYNLAWRDEKLWSGDTPPKFGIYDGDVHWSHGNVYYTKFSAKGA